MLIDMIAGVVMHDAGGAYGIATHVTFHLGIAQSSNWVSMMLHYMIVNIAVLVGLFGTHKTGCSGEARLVLHIPSSS